MTTAHCLFTWLLVLSTCAFCTARVTRKWRPQEQRTQITDFRYNSARIDGITRLFNDSLIVISNGQYWFLNKGELPRAHNVKGPISQLFPGFKQIDSIWTDPYNDISPQIYLTSNTAKYGLRVVCQEFFEQFLSDSSFCHLPVDGSWKNALKDLDLDKPIDAVTWRNRTKDKDGGFWVFFQGTKMITIDPYEMRLRFTYDIKKWMSINETITAAYYDYRSHEYHFFFDRNLYRIWKVNVSFMNSLPMSWDRAFLHGTLSLPLKINRDFFGFSEHEIRNRRQPGYEKISSIEEINDNRLDRKDTIVSGGKPSEKETLNRNRVSTTTENSLSDVLYVSPRGQILHNRVPNGKLQTQDQNDQLERNSNSLEQSDKDMISYQKQLMQFGQEGVLDFASDSAINATANWTNGQMWVCFVLLCTTLLQRLITA